MGRMVGMVGMGGWEDGRDRRDGMDGRETPRPSTSPSYTGTAAAPDAPTSSTRPVERPAEKLPVSIAWKAYALRTALLQR